MRRGGTADLPLHGGRVPKWLAERMTRLGTAIVEAIVQNEGAPAVLSRLSDPFWFQALGCAMGMDWHSSGITTSVVGALKRGLNPRSGDLGLWVCGGRGRHSRRTPEELLAIADRTGLAGDELVRASRLSAKVDNTALQDGFQIYLHAFFLTSLGEWAVVQQGMNDATGMARRYHWHSATVRSFVEQPHQAIVGENQGTILNLVDRGAVRAQEGILAIVREEPERSLGEIRRLVMPRRHAVRPADVDLVRLGAVLAVAYAEQPVGFADLLLVRGLGPRTLQSLALAAEVIHGAPCRFQDPARFSFAHGGKDGHPHPVLTKVYDETIAVLEGAVAKARLAESDRVDALRRLHDLVRRAETTLRPHADLDRLIARERREAPAFGGRTVGGRQLEIFGDGP